MRLLDEHVLTEGERRHGDREVHVVGRRHRHRVDRVAQLVEHDAEVAEVRDARELLEGLGGPLVVDVAEGDQVLPLHPVDRVVAAPAHPAARDVDLVDGRLAAGPLRAQEVRQRDRCGGERGGL
jgi:hypothetical protein